MKPPRELRNLVLGYLHDLAEADPSYIDLVSASPDALGFGTDPKELWIGGTRIRAIGPAMALAGGLAEIIPGHIRAFEEGTVGWAAGTSTATLREGRVLESALPR